MTASGDAAYDLAELNKEQTFGGIGTIEARDVPRIDMSGFDASKAEIADQLWRASTEIGFFQIVNHSIPQEQIDEAFAITERFFAPPHETKAHYPLPQGHQRRLRIKARCALQPLLSIKKNLTRSPCRGWRDCGRRVMSSPASRR
jgi:non-haem dioxygenase in morphine synthesis N-terminal